MAMAVRRWLLPVPLLPVMSRSCFLLDEAEAGELLDGGAGEAGLEGPVEGLEGLSDLDAAADDPPLGGAQESSELGTGSPVHTGIDRHSPTPSCRCSKSVTVVAESIHQGRRRPRLIKVFDSPGGQDHGARPVGGGAVPVYTGEGEGAGEVGWIPVCTGVPLG
jgi:hypothetical protein